MHFAVKMQSKVQSKEYAMEKAEYDGNDGFLQRDNKVWQSGNCDKCANIASGTVCGDASPLFALTNNTVLLMYVLYSFKRSKSIK